MSKVVKFITLGCKVNQYETNAMAQKFLEKGYEIIEEETKENENKIEQSKEKVAFITLRVQSKSI